MNSKVTPTSVQLQKSKPPEVKKLYKNEVKKSSNSLSSKTMPQQPIVLIKQQVKKLSAVDDKSADKPRARVVEMVDAWTQTSGRKKDKFQTGPMVLKSQQKS